MDYRTFDLWAIQPNGYKTARPYSLPYPGNEDRRAVNEHDAELRRRKEETRSAWLKTHGFRLYHGDGLWRTEGHADNLFHDVRRLGSAWIDHDGVLTRPGVKGYFMFTQPYLTHQPFSDLVDALDPLGFEVIHAAWDGWHYPESCPLIVIGAKPGTPLTNGERAKRERAKIKSMIDAINEAGD